MRSKDFRVRVWRFWNSDLGLEIRLQFHHPFLLLVVVKLKNWSLDVLLFGFFQNLRHLRLEFGNKLGSDTTVIVLGSQPRKSSH